MSLSHQKSPITTSEFESDRSDSISQHPATASADSKDSGIPTWSASIPPLLPGVPQSLIDKYASEPDPYVRNSLINEEFSLTQHQPQGVGTWIWSSLDTIGSYMDYFGGIIASWIGLRDSKYQDVIESLEWEKFENEQLEKMNRDPSESEPSPSSSLPNDPNENNAQNKPKKINNISLSDPENVSPSIQPSDASQQSDWQSTPVSVPEDANNSESIVPIS